MLMYCVPHSGILTVIVHAEVNILSLNYFDSFIFYSYLHLIDRESVPSYTDVINVTALLPIIAR